MSGGLVKARSARALLDITQRVGNISARSEECKSKTICGIYAEEKMEIVAFLSDITSHLSDLNMKLQGKNNTVCNITSAVCAF